MAWGVGDNTWIPEKSKAPPPAGLQDEHKAVRARGGAQSLAQSMASSVAGLELIARGHAANGHSSRVSSTPSLGCASCKVPPTYMPPGLC